MKEPYFGVVPLRALFDLSFFIIVTTLGLNIVIAILVDGFSELREKRVSHFSCSLLLGDEERIGHCIVFLSRTKSKKTN